MLWRCLSIVLIAAGCATGTDAFPEFRVPPKQSFPAPKPPLDVPKDRAAWEARRTELRRQWETILGPMPKRVPLEPQVVSREELPDHTRLLVRYRNDAGSDNDAYVLLPKGKDGTPLTGPLPGAVCFHATSATSLRDPVGLAGRESVHYALHLVRRGYVCVAPRNFLWAVPGRSYQQAAEDLFRRGPFTTGMAKMVWDGIRAVDLLLDRPEVDPKRIVTIGHSLGGKEALYLAAFDDRVAVAVSCEGGVGLSFSNWDADWYLGKQIKSPQFAHDNHEVLALIAPRALLLIGGESADGAKSWPYVETCLPAWRLYRDEERLGLLRDKGGHNFPEPGPDRERVYGWLDQMLKRDGPE